MDQLKKQLAVVMQYGFWIGTSIVLLGSVGVWYTTTSTLNEENRSQTSRLDAARSSVQTVRGEMDTQPNELSHAKMNELIEARKNEVFEAWDMLYKRQQGILTWPEEELSTEFVDEFEHMIPVELHMDYPTSEEDEVVQSLRMQYQRYIQDVLPSIADIAKAEWVAKFDESAAGSDGDIGMGMEMMSVANPTNTNVDQLTGVEAGPLVVWAKGSQTDVLDDLFPWRSNGIAPTTLEVYYSQENIWILKQMLEIVANVNGDAEQSYQAKVKEITSIKIGKSVKFGAGEIAKPGDGIKTGGMGMGMDMEEMENMGMGMEESALPGASSTTSLDPGDSRYLNSANEPITGAALRTALKSTSASDAELVVAKRVPVMMSVQIDQRYIQRLLAECGSAALMVEVSQVRLLPKGGATALLQAEGGEDGMGEMGMNMEGGEGGLQGLSQLSRQAEPEENPLDLTVEIYGLIYMYNPPDKEKLGFLVDDVGSDENQPANPDDGELPSPDENDTNQPVAADNTAAPAAIAIPNP